MSLMDCHASFCLTRITDETQKMKPGVGQPFSSASPRKRAELLREYLRYLSKNEIERLALAAEAMALLCPPDYFQPAVRIHAERLGLVTDDDGMAVLTNAGRRFVAILERRALTR